MLIAALALTVAGFVALVVAVATGQIAFAWICIVAGILGVALLLADWVKNLLRGRKLEIDTRHFDDAEGRGPGGGGYASGTGRWP